MTKIEDLSFSGITGRLQGDKEEAASMLYSIALETEEIKKEIESLENELRAKITRKKELHLGSKHVVVHLKKHLPIMVSRIDYAVVITEGAISIERNVI